MHNLEPENGKTFLYRLEGNALIVNQYDIGNVILLRLHSEDIDERLVEKFKEEITKNASQANIMILPPWIDVIKISPSMKMLDDGSNTMVCNKCGASMRQQSDGSLLCFSCGNQHITGAMIGAGTPLRVGGL